MKRRTVILLIAAVSVLSALLGVTVTVAAMGGDEPTALPTATASALPSASPTPSETESPSPATPSTTPSVLDGATAREIFSWLTIPVPADWRSQGGDGDNHEFADFSSCSISASSCPSVEFTSLTGGPNRVNYGGNPIGQWARDVCPSRPAGSEKMTEQTMIGAYAATGYQLSCKGVELYAWVVPNRLLVLTRDVGSTPAKPETIQAVLRYSTVG